MEFSRAVILPILAYLIICFTSGSYADSFGKIAFTVSTVFSSEIVVAAANGEDMQVLTEGLYPSWSPDGSMIAFAEGIVNSEIYVIGADGGPRKSPGINGTYPLFSPDGKKIAYLEIFFSMPTVKMWLCIADIDGENQKRLKHLNSIAGIPHSWSPDGEQIAYCDTGGLYIINVETTECKKIVCPKVDGEIKRLVNVDWSPKWDKLALISEDIGDHGIWIVNTDGSGAKRLTRDAQFAPEWSPDGTEIAFVDNDGSDSNKIYIMDSGGKNIRRLTHSLDIMECENDPAWFGMPAAIQPQNSSVTTWGGIRANSG